MDNIAPKLQKMLDTPNCLQHHTKNDKATKLLLQSAFRTSEGSTCKVLPFYNFSFDPILNMRKKFLVYVGGGGGGRQILLPQIR